MLRAAVVCLFCGHCEPLLAEGADAPREPWPRGSSEGNACWQRALSGCEEDAVDASCFLQLGLSPAFRPGSGSLQSAAPAPGRPAARLAELLSRRQQILLQLGLRTADQAGGLEAFDTSNTLEDTAIEREVVMLEARLAELRRRRGDVHARTKQQAPEATLQTAQVAPVVLALANGTLITEATLRTAEALPVAAAPEVVNRTVAPQAASQAAKAAPGALASVVANGTVVAQAALQTAKVAPAAPANGVANRTPVTQALPQRAEPKPAPSANVSAVAKGSLGAKALTQKAGPKPAPSATIGAVASGLLGAKAVPERNASASALHAGSAADNRTSSVKVVPRSVTGALTDFAAANASVNHTFNATLAAEAVPRSVAGPLPRMPGVLDPTSAAEAVLRSVAGPLPRKPGGLSPTLAAEARAIARDSHVSNLTEGFRSTANATSEATVQLPWPLDQLWPLIFGEDNGTRNGTHNGTHNGNHNGSKKSQKNGSNSSKNSTKGDNETEEASGTANETRNATEASGPTEVSNSTQGAGHSQANTTANKTEAPGATGASNATQGSSHSQGGRGSRTSVGMTPSLRKRGIMSAVIFLVIMLAVIASLIFLVLFRRSEQ